MAERDGNPRRFGIGRAYPRSLELEINHLQDLHRENAPALRGAFSDPVIEILLRRLSEDDFFRQPVSESTRESSYFADVSATTARDISLVSSAASSPENWETTRNLFEFIYTEFMPAPEEEQIGRFRRFLDRIMETAHENLPDGTGFSSEHPRLQQCILAINTLKEVISTNFKILKNFLDCRQRSAPPPGAGIDRSYGARQTGESSTVNTSREAHQNAPERNAATLGSLPPSNRGASTVSVGNPVRAAGGSVLPVQQMRPSVVQPNPARPRLNVASGVDQEDRPTSSPPRNRPRLERQAHVPDESSDS